MKKWQNTENRLIPLGGVAFIFAIWEVTISLFQIPKYILPAPSAIFKTLIEARKILWQHTQTTLMEAALGFCIAILFGVLVAGLMNKYNLIKKTLYPMLVISQTVPIIALAPLFMIWLGYDMLPKIVIVVLVCFFPISVSVTEGLNEVDQDLINLMKVMKAGSWKIFTKVEIPSVMPAFFSGLKIAATYSIMGAVIAEWIGAKSGLGIYMTRAMASFRTEALFADIFIIVVLSVGLFKIIEGISHKVMPWNR